MPSEEGNTPNKVGRVLVLTKTYPLPSDKYQETTCVAGITEAGELRRIYPVPFRRLQGAQQFSRWQWMTALLGKATRDARPESRKIDTSTITLGEKIGTADGWRERLSWIEPHILPTFEALAVRREETGQSLGLLRPSRLLGLDITPLAPDERDWTDAEKAKLTHELMQPDLFDTGPQHRPPLLEKIPFAFHYRYEITAPDGSVSAHRHLITDWEASALYRNCRAKHGGDWEKPFRDRLETKFPEQPLVFLMGTVHRFPSQWLLIGLIYPPKPTAAQKAQAVLEL